MFGVGIATLEGIGMIRVLKSWHDVGWSSLIPAWALVLAATALLIVNSFEASPAQEAGAVLVDPASPIEPAVPLAVERIIVVVGAAGAHEYAQEFSGWLQAWNELAKQANWSLTVVGDANPSEIDGAASNEPVDDLQKIDQAIAAHAGDASRLWIVLLGHGTYAAGEAKFNLVGPDLSAKKLSSWLAPLNCPAVIVNCSSASGPFLPELSGPGRIVITATRSGTEINFSRFGKFFVEAMRDLTADVDHDEAVSLLEVFLLASAQTERFYADQSRLVTEHALLEDNADRVGSASDFFQAGRSVRVAQGPAQVDGLEASGLIVLAAPHAPQFSAAQLIERKQLEQELDKVRGRKGELTAEAYYAELEVVLLKLSELYTAATAVRR